MPARENAPWELRLVPRTGFGNPAVASFAVEIVSDVVVHNTLWMYVVRNGAKGGLACRHTVFVALLEVYDRNTDVHRKLWNSGTWGEF
jgi:hypothetical protein